MMPRTKREKSYCCRHHVAIEASSINQRKREPYRTLHQGNATYNSIDTLSSVHSRDNLDSSLHRHYIHDIPLLWFYTRCPRQIDQLQYNTVQNGLGTLSVSHCKSQLSINNGGQRGQR